MIIAILFILAQVAASPSQHEAVERLRAKTPVEVVAADRIENLARRYTSTSKELGKRIDGFLSGDDLYLFADGSYIYCEWADIEPVTIHDKGTWTFADGLVELKSGPEVTWDSGKYRQYDRKYIAVRRSSRGKEILLVGVEYALKNFEEGAGQDSAFMLLVVAKKRETAFTKARTKKIKAKLMKESWRPEYFHEGSR